LSSCVVCQANTKRTAREHMALRKRGSEREKLARTAASARSNAIVASAQLARAAACCLPSPSPAVSELPPAEDAGAGWANTFAIVVGAAAAAADGVPVRCGPRPSLAQRCATRACSSANSGGACPHERVTASHHAHRSWPAPPVPLWHCTGGTPPQHTASTWSPPASSALLLLPVISTKQP
jgi:hypothetical protein